VAFAVIVLVLFVRSNGGLPTGPAAERPTTPTGTTGVSTQAPAGAQPTQAPTLAAVPSPAAPADRPLGQSGTWQLAFSDDFSGPGLDEMKWHTCFWWSTTTCSIQSNAEEQLYNPDDVLVQDGMLRLRAQQRPMIGWNGDQYEFTSGMVSTGGRKYEKPPGFTFTYGYVEAQVRVPRGKGFWSTLWMLPLTYNSLPEIDIFEILGQQPTGALFNYHWLSTGQYAERQSGTWWAGPDFSADWHTFGLDWQRDVLVWYVDGVERFRFSAAPNAPVPSEPMYLLLTLAVGGEWPGSPDASTPFPSYLDMRSVRVWVRT
jgi:beta-glucanase (GH16 family)